MKSSILRFALAALLLSSSAATPQMAGGPGQSLLSGQTLGQGSSSVHAQLGWPGFGLSLLHGLGPKLDVGAKLSLLYGYEGITRLERIPGMKVQGVVRLNLLERGKLNLGLRFSPGFFFYFWDGYTQPGLALPIDVMMGLRIAPNVMVSFGLDFPIYVAFGDYAGMVFPVLAGGGVEYFLDKQLGFTFNVRAGPSALVTNDYPYYYYCYDRFGRTYQCRGRTLVAAEFLVGVSYKF